MYCKTLAVAIKHSKALQNLSATETQYLKCYGKTKMPCSVEYEHQRLGI